LDGKQQLLDVLVGFPRLPCSCPPLAALELYVNKSTITAIKLLILRSFQKGVVQ